MKKKEIEKIPYIGIQKVSRKKGVKYIAATAVEVIKNENHLITEVYRNRKEDLAVPLVRIVLTEKDFGTFFVKEGRWSRMLIAGSAGGYYTGKYPVWEKGGNRYNAKEENEIRSNEDLQRIKSFPGVEEKSWKSQKWYEMINDRIDDISTKERRAREIRRCERRQQGLKERTENTPKLDEEKILDYADRVIFLEKHYLYYKKNGVRVRVACSKCGGVTERRWKLGISYESQFEPMIEEPRQGCYGTCPLCGASGEWKPQGKAMNEYVKTGHLFIGQKYKETGMVFRYIEIEKRYKLGLICEETGMVMKNACEEISGIEIARAYFEEGKKPQKDYHKRNPYSGREFWDDCNLCGLANISINKAPILRETYEEMQGTILQYSAMKEYEAAEEGYINPVEYAERYLHTPQIEMLTKLGLIKVVESLVKYRYGIVANENANRVDTFLGIRKEHIRQLIRYQGEESILKVMQAEKRLGQHWTDEQIDDLAEIKITDMTGWSEVLKHMGIQKMLNLIEKYAKKRYKTESSLRLQAVAMKYFDYLNMRQELGYDLSNTVYLAPRNLNEAHQKMVMEQNKEKTDLQIREVNLKYPLIKKHYRRLRRKFFYEDEDFIIRPARDAGEIVMEGRILHHCVGRDKYLQKHNDGVTTILFLRLKTEPDVPYITVEIGTDNLKIMQWYGAHDNKIDEKNIDRWLNSYVVKLKCGLIGAMEEAGETAEQPLAMLA